MSLVVLDAETLARELSDRFSGPLVVGIDGWTGVGKTTLAKTLAALMNGNAYDLDSALNCDQRVYATALRLHEVSAALRDSDRPLFVSGICLREVLSQVGGAADAYVYMKRMATWGWADEDDLAGELPDIPGASGELMRQEIRLYHAKFQPHLRADFEFHRFD